MKKTITAVTVAALLSGCANLATVNGIPVNDEPVISSSGKPAYCQQYKARCIIGVAVGVGVLGYIINEANDDNGNVDEGSDTF